MCAAQVGIAQSFYMLLKYLRFFLQNWRCKYCRNNLLGTQIFLRFLINMYWGTVFSYHGLWQQLHCPESTLAVANLDHLDNSRD